MPGRDPWLDNAKIILVTSFVVGHFWFRLPDTQLGNQIYDWLYFFHMPAFLIVTGYLSRRTEWTRRHFFAIATTLLVPYVIFELALVMFRTHVGGEEGLGEHLWLNPHWPMWFLIVLALWRVLTPVLRSHKAMIPLSVVISLASGFVEAPWFDLDRAMGFLPFYVVGLHLTPGALERIRAPRSRAWGVLALVALWPLAARTNDWVSTEWLYYREGFTALDVASEQGLYLRAGVLLVSMVTAFAALTLIPTTWSRVTDFARYTLVIYLFHGFFVRSAMYLDFAAVLPDSTVGSLLATSTLGVAVALALGSPPVGRRLAWLADPVNQVLTARRRRREQEPERVPQERERVSSR